jgi:hypothetical protein
MKLSGMVDAQVVLALEKEPGVPLDWRLGGCQSISCSFRESKPNFSVLQPVECRYTDLNM